MNKTSKSIDKEQKFKKNEFKTLQKISFGYLPNPRMKPVHFATSFLLCLHGSYSILETLNKAANPRSAEKAQGDEYVAENLYNRLRKENILAPTLSIEDFKSLRPHLKAIYDNDGGAAAAFKPYSTFGCDYSTPSMAYLANQSKLHGNSGAFVWLVINSSAVGREFLKLAKKIAESASGPAATLGKPLLDIDDTEYSKDILELCGDPPQSKIVEISQLMQSQTEALLCLAQNLVNHPTPYALRKLIIGVGSWLLIYQIRHITTAKDTLFFSDFIGESKPRVRAQATACYARQIGLFGRSLKIWLNENPHFIVDQEYRDLFEKTDASMSKELEDHFRDFSERIGWVQPRSGTSNKYFRAVPDTMRVLLLSILNEDEVITIAELAEKLRIHWRLVFGLLPEDHEILRKNGYTPLDEDTDLRANRAAFIQLAKHLGFAWEPSDGLVLFSLNPDKFT